MRQKKYMSNYNAHEYMEKQQNLLPHKIDITKKMSNQPETMHSWTMEKLIQNKLLDGHVGEKKTNKHEYEINQQVNIKKTCDIRVGGFNDQIGTK